MSMCCVFAGHLRDAVLIPTGLAVQEETSEGRRPGSSEHTILRAVDADA